MKCGSCTKVRLISIIYNVGHTQAQGYFGYDILSCGHILRRFPSIINLSVQLAVEMPKTHLDPDHKRSALRDECPNAKKSYHDLLTGDRESEADIFPHHSTEGGWEEYQNSSVVLLSLSMLSAQVYVGHSVLDFVQPVRCSTVHGFSFDPKFVLDRRIV